MAILTPQQAVRGCALDVRELTVTYPTRNGALTALRGLSFAAPPGEFLAIVGPSGCGKSTLLRVLAGLLAPADGTVSLAGSSPDTARRRRQIGLAFQSPALLPWRTLAANIALPLEVGGATRELTQRQVAQLLSLTGLADYALLYPHQLSGGMQQRAALARALAHQPPLLLLDEPFGALDELTREALGQELVRLWQASGATVLLVTHSVQEAVALADRVLVLSPRPGRIVAEQPIALPHPRSPEATAHLVAQVRGSLGDTRP